MIVAMVNFAARQLANLSAGRDQSTPASLAAGLELAATTTLREGKFVYEPVRVILYPGTKGRRRFIHEVSNDGQVLRSKLRAVGFGLLARGVGSYAPTACMVFFHYLCNQEKRTKEFREKLARSTLALVEIRTRFGLPLGKHLEATQMAVTIGYAEPDGPTPEPSPPGSDRPRISRSAVDIDAMVDDFITWFLQNDLNAPEILHPCLRTILAKGVAPSELPGHNPEWLADEQDMVSWFLRKMRADIRALRGASREEFSGFLDQLIEQGMKSLMTAGEVSRRYQMDFEPFDYDVEVRKIDSLHERDDFDQNFIDQAVLGSETRVLGWLYQVWFDDVFVIKKVGPKPTGLVCPSCAVSNSNTARFCKACGQRVDGMS